MVNTIIQPVFGKILGKILGIIKQVQGKRRYQLARAHHADQLPKLTGIDQEIATGLTKDSVHITTLEPV